MAQETKPKPQPKPQANQQTFDAEIGLFEKEFIEIAEKMEKTSQRFVAATIATLKHWFPNTAKAYVQEQYELSNNLGIEKIRELKQGVARLVASVPQDALRLLCDGNLWWHKSRGGGWQDHFAQGPPDGLSMAIWALAERIRPLLESYGYIKRDPKKDEPTPEDAPKTKRPKSRKHELPEIEWTDEMKKCIELYKEDLGRATFLDGKIAQAKKRKAIHNAGLLWDKA